MAHKLAAFDCCAHKLSQILVDPVEFIKKVSILKGLARIDNVQIDVE